MASEHAFLRQRLALVELRLATQHPDSILSDTEWVRGKGPSMPPWSPLWNGITLSALPR